MLDLEEYIYDLGFVDDRVTQWLLSFTYFNSSKMCAIY